MSALISDALRFGHTHLNAEDSVDAEFAEVYRIRWNPHALEYKYYAPDIGLLQDEQVKLVKYGRK